MFQAAAERKACQQRHTAFQLRQGANRVSSKDADGRREEAASAIARQARYPPVRALSGET